MERPYHILYCLAGAGARRAGELTRDLALAAGLRGRGHQVEIVPFFTDPGLAGLAPGPDSPVLLRGATWRPGWAGTAGRRLLRPLTGRCLPDNDGDRRHPAYGRAIAELLAGSDGPLAAEWNAAFRQLAGRPRPDAVLLSHGWLAPLAEFAKREWNAPLIALFSDEDLLVDKMPAGGGGRVRRQLRDRARGFDSVWTGGLHAALRAADFYAVRASRNRIVPSALPDAVFGGEPARIREPLLIGYLAPIEADGGLLTLARALGMLRRGKGREAWLQIAGPVRDPGYWRAVRRLLRFQKVEDRVTVCGEMREPERRAFFRGLSVFCVPARVSETRNLAWHEAMAAGVPVLAPASGMFPELLRRSGGGTLLPPDSPAMLAESFALLMDEPDVADSIGRRGRRAMLRGHTQDHVAARAETHLAELVDGIQPPPPSPPAAGAGDNGDEAGDWHPKVVLAR